MSNRPNSARPADNAVRLSGALLGLLVFFAGIGLLVFVFQTAKTLYEAPAPRLLAAPSPSPTAAPLSTPTPGARPNAASRDDAASTAVAAIGDNLVGFGRQLLLLLVMCIAGSVIASRGVELFFKSCAAMSVPPPPTGEKTGTPS